MDLPLAEMEFSGMRVGHKVLSSHGRYNMRLAVTLAVIFFATSVVAMMATPTGDPYTYCMSHALFLCVAIPCYFIGLRHGRMPAETRDNTGTQNTANTSQAQSPPAADQPPADGSA